jgi:DNA-binding response OmpR family regulator
VTGEPILIVEDDPDIVRVVKVYLEHEGFAVEVARDGLSGLHKALECPPALIVLDWMLPRLDGPRFMSRLRAKLDTPVIMLTARRNVSIGLRHPQVEFRLAPPHSR